MAIPSLRAAAALVSTLIVLASIEPVVAQEAPAVPRTPMSPGSFSFKDSRSMVPIDRDRVLWGMAPAKTEPTASGAPSRMPDLLALDTAAITIVAEGKADIVVSSRSPTELSLQLYRPDQNQWQEFRLAPFANTPVSCEPCRGKLRFSFNDGVQQSEINLDAPAMLRIFPDQSGTHWQWDSFRLQAAAKPD